MFKTVEAPYFTPDPRSLTAQEWQINEGEDSRALPDFLSSWSQGSDIHLSRIVELDVARVFEEARLTPGTTLAIAVSWMSEASKIRRRVFRGPLGDQPLKVDVRLNGDEISGKIRLHTSLIVDNQCEDADRWVASEPGAMLLSESVPLTLEGDGAAFPMAVVDFAATAFPPAASWHVVTSADLEARFSSSFQVMINERDRKLVRAIEAEKPSREEIVLIEIMMGDVIATVLELAYHLRGSGALDDDGYEEGTVGAVLRGFVEQSGAVPYEVSEDPTQMLRRRSFFAALARTIGAGRGF